jgi:N-acetyltransferase
MNFTVTLMGHLVRLEPLRVDHADALVAAATEPGTTYAYTSVPSDEATAAVYIETALAEQATAAAIPFVIIDVSRRRIVGSTRYLDLAYWTGTAARVVPAPVTARAPTVAEIGATWLAPSAQRTGINTETKLLMLGHAFDEWKVHRVTLKTDVRNQRSRRAIERIGATYEGIRRAHTPASDGTIRDTAYYSILATEWPGVEQHLRRLLERGSPHGTHANNSREG